MPPSDAHAFALRVAYMRRAQRAHCEAVGRASPEQLATLALAAYNLEREVDELLDRILTATLTLDDLDQPGPPEALALIGKR